MGGLAIPGKCAACEGKTSRRSARLCLECRIAAQAGPQPERRKDYSEAIKMYVSGMSLQEIGAFFGTSRQSMWEILKRRDVKMRPQARFKAENHFFRGGKSEGSKRASHVVEKAILKGVLTRPALCETCKTPGREYKNKRAPIQAHHPNYNKPLDVMWLCRDCHREWHRRNRPIQLERR